MAQSQQVLEEMPGCVGEEIEAAWLKDCLQLRESSGLFWPSQSRAQLGRDSSGTKESPDIYRAIFLLF